MIYTEIVKCKVCNNKMSAKDIHLNAYRICKFCLDSNIAKESKKRNLNKYLK